MMMETNARLQIQALEVNTENSNSRIQYDRYAKHYINVEETNMIGNLDERTTRGYQANLASGETTLVQGPETFVEALRSDKSKKWELAIQEELEALTRNGTFGEVQDLPQGSKTVKCKFD